MPCQDIHSNIKQLVALNGATVSTATTTVGNIIDTQDFEALEYIISSGAWTAGTAEPVLEESDDAAFAVSNVVDPEYILGDATVDVIDGANQARRIGTVGFKRYQRLSLTTVGGAVDVYLNAVAALGYPRSAPVEEV